VTVLPGASLGSAMVYAARVIISGAFCHVRERSQRRRRSFDGARSGPRHSPLFALVLAVAALPASALLSSPSITS